MCSLSNLYLKAEHSRPDTNVSVRTAFHTILYHRNYTLGWRINSSLKLIWGFVRYRIIFCTFLHWDYPLGSVVVEYHVARNFIFKIWATIRFLIYSDSFSSDNNFSYWNFLEVLTSELYELYTIIVSMASSSFSIVWLFIVNLLCFNALSFGCTHWLID